ncbi:hypothetical protein ACIQZO_06030 [Streptomyces sp. NPDC097617]|uniref:hypothetical protein n=1 Tax=Streptomyces sp. NPDC097617 TaxID=3366091 RepID=UPI003808AE99
MAWLDGPALNTLMAWGGVITLVVGVGGATWRFVRASIRTGTRMNEFMDDWYGEVSRPGVEERPGMMHRVKVIEDRLRRVEHELYPNSGGSLRDAVDLANERLARLCPDAPDEGGCPPPQASAGQ